MLEIASLLLAYFAFAALHAAAPVRAPWRARRATTRLWGAALRLVSLGSFLATVALWQRIEVSALAFIVPLFALMVSAGLFVLLVPIVPRVMWGLAALCLVAAPVLVLLGLRHG